MNNIAQAPLAPKIFRFDDIDAFRSSVRNLNVDFTPLTRKISAEQIVLNLPGCDVNFTKSFPRIIDAQLDPNCTCIGFAMDAGVPIRFNGVESERSVIVIGGGSASYSQVELAPRQYASIIFSPEVDDRGWPQTGPIFKVFEVRQAALQLLQELVLEVLSVSAEFADGSDVNGVSAGIRESLLAAVDHAFAEVVPARWTTRANSSPQHKIFQDMRAALLDASGHRIYSADLAQQIGVSVRTLHDAVRRYRGMSLHQYMRLRRLWLVRQRLLAGTSSVKACALDFGFWHLGDFSRSYRLQFGELPSETLARSRKA